MTAARILVAEDEQITSQNLSRRLERLGYDVVAVVDSGETAIEKARELRPCLVLMDIHLAGDIDGIEAAGRIRAETGVPVVYLTAYADDGTLTRAKETNPLGYLLKPFEAEALRTTVDMALHRRRLEDQLRASEARYRAVSELISDFAYSLRVDTDGSLHCEWMTDAFHRITGRPADGGGDWGDIVHPEDRMLYDKRLENLLNGMPDVREYRIFNDRGDVRWIRDSARAEWDVQDRRVAKIIGAAQDITHQKEVEEALRGGQQLYAALFEHNPVQTVVVDHEGRIMAYNRAKETSGDRLPPLGAVMYREYAARHNQDMYAQLMSCIADGKTREFHDMAYGDRVLNIAIAPFERGAIITTQDVTEIHRAEQRRRSYETKFRQAQKLESLGMMAGGIAHDFNNLLMAVLGNAELAMMDLPDEAPMRGNIAAIEKAARRAAELAAQMLAYSGKGRLKLEVVDPNAIVQEAARAMGPEVPENVKLLLDLEPRLPGIVADPLQVQQVVANLVTNAIEAIGEKTGTIAVRSRRHHVDATSVGRYTITELAEGDYVVVEVRDTGCGIDPNDAERIFDPFFTTKFTGRGLGLAAALGIVRGHRGSMRAEGSLGQGATIAVYLPTAAQDNTPGRAIGPAHAPCILIVDDEEAVRSVASDMLTREGYRVERAADGAEGVEMLRHKPDAYHCVLLDFAMPRMDGERALEAIRTIRADIPVILSSGYSVEEATRRLASLDLAGFLQKPYQSHKLLEEVERVLSRHTKPPIKGA